MFHFLHLLLSSAPHRWMGEERKIRCPSSLRSHRAGLTPKLVHLVWVCYFPPSNMVIQTFLPFCEFVLSWWKRCDKEGIYGSPFIPVSLKWISSTCARFQISKSPRVHVFGNGCSIHRRTNSQLCVQLHLRDVQSRSSSSSLVFVLHCTDDK